MFSVLIVKYENQGKVASAGMWFLFYLRLVFKKKMEGKSA
jgi:hypothetical protein